MRGICPQARCRLAPAWHGAWRRRSPPIRAALGASAPAAAASAPAQPARCGHPVQREGRRHLPVLPRPGSDTATFSTAAIFKTRHAHRGNQHAPFGAGGLQCEACHGPGAKHATKGSNKKQTINSFKPTSFLTVAERNAACLDCHQDSARNGWHASAHERSPLACTNCHKLHAERDAVLTKADQPEVCFNCHKKQRADFQKASTHPVRFGLMRLQRLPQPARLAEHGDADQADAEPDLLHLPRREARAAAVGARAGGRRLHVVPLAATARCARALLTKSPPLLCQQCHSQAGHPSVARTGAALPGGSGGGADLPARGQLHQLPLAGARVESSVRCQADAMKTASPCARTGVPQRPRTRP